MQQLSGPQQKMFDFSVINESRPLFFDENVFRPSIKK